MCEGISHGSAREAAMMAFLQRAGWDDATREPLAGDASTRRYLRLRRGGATAVLMDAPPAAETAACPPGASPDEREALGYNALARLAGPDLGRFVALADHLAGLGLAAPRVKACDLDQGFLMLEDLGDNLFARAIVAGAEPAPLYESAVDVLLHLYEAVPPAVLAGRGAEPVALLDYDKTALLTEVALVTEWYLPLVEGGPVGPDRVGEYLGLWQPLLARLEATGRAVLTLRDFHAENLIWRPGETGLARVGLLDFQDAVIGRPAYDLVSLTEDARRDVDADLAARAEARFIDGARARDPHFDADAFGFERALLAAQRNAKILGIFARLAVRDGKPAYLAMIPRLWRYLAKDLAHPDLAPLAVWFKRTVPAAARGRPPALKENPR